MIEPAAPVKRPVFMIAICSLLVLLVCLTAITRIGSNANQTYAKVGNAVNTSGGPFVPREAPTRPPASQPQIAKAAKPAGGQAPPAAPPAVPRKIIFTSHVEIVVEDFAKTEQELLRIVKEHKAYVSKSDIHGTTGVQRSGVWTVRVPVEQFDTFLSAVAALGELQKNSLDSQDVSEEFYDLEARLKNKRVEEERLVKHLKDSTGKLEEILLVEKEISRVRGEIETMEGRLKKLTNLTELTTVTVTVHERRGYVPPSAPTFGMSIGRTFEGSLEMLVNLGKFLVLAVVAIAPWLPLVAVVAIPFWIAMRRSAKRAAAPTSSSI